MDPIEERELKRQAWQRLAAQRRRAGLLRGRVVAISLICFALLWGSFAALARPLVERPHRPRLPDGTRLPDRA